MFMFMNNNIIFAESVENWHQKLGNLKWLKISGNAVKDLRGEDERGILNSGCFGRLKF